MEILTFAMELRTMSVLPKVLLLCSRLGGSVRYVSAAGERANIVLSAPSRAAHRFAPQLRRIVDVVDLAELRGVNAEDDRGPVRQAPALRHTA
jgi:hypothetical protein